MQISSLTWGNAISEMQKSYRLISNFFSSSFLFVSPSNHTWTQTTVSLHSTASSKKTQYCTNTNLSHVLAFNSSSPHAFYWWLYVFIRRDLVSMLSFFILPWVKLPSSFFFFFFSFSYEDFCHFKIMILMIFVSILFTKLYRFWSLLSTLFLSRPLSCYFLEHGFLEYREYI